MSFDWQTEDDQKWEQSDGPAERGPRRRPWFWLILFVGLFGAGLYLGWQEVQERVEANTEARREEVRASYTLVHRAAAQRDQELFVSLLSGRSATWTAAQKERLERGLLFGETGRLLHFAAATQQTNPDVQFNPDLSEGVLTVAQPVLVDAGSGLTETVVFTQTHVFRQGSQRWLLSPPDDAFWGEWGQTAGQNLRLAYPGRDEELALRLADDLDRKLSEMCRTLVACPADFQMSVRFESDPQSIVQLANGEARLAPGRELVLPAPTLVGLPTDEASYAALFRGYAAHVVSAALVTQLDYECCDLVLFEEALLHWQQSRLGLRSEPISTGDYLYVIDAPLNVDGLWQRAEALAPGEEAPLEVHAFIDFMRNKLSMRRDPLITLQEALSQSRSFWGWIAPLTTYEPTDPTVLENEWSAFVWDKAREAQSLAQPLPRDQLPQQDIIAMCGDTAMDLYRYSLLDGQWAQEIEAGVQFAALQGLPGGDGYLFTGQYPDQDFDTGLVTYLKRGQETPFMISQTEPADSAILPWGLTDPEGRRMVVWLLSERTDDAGLPNVALIDPQTCTSDGCPPQPLPGMPIWSPEGRLGLAIDTLEGQPLYLPPDKTRWQTLDGESAIWPFWLDADTIAYVDLGPMDSRHRLVALNLRTAESRDIVTSHDLADAAGPGHRGESFHIALGMRHPFRDDTLVVLANGSFNPSESHLFAVSLGSNAASLRDDTSRLTLLQSFAGVIDGGFFGFTSGYQNDRYLLLTLSDNSGRSGTRMIVYDLRAEQVAFSSIGGLGDYFLSGEGSWSSDGRWLVRTLDRAIDIIGPAVTRDGRPYRQLIFHDFERCQLATWVNR